MNLNWNNVVKNINTLLVSEEEEIPAPPEINITDDIGLSEGFKAIIDAKISGKSDSMTYAAELNSDQYEKFEPSLAKHKFILDFRYKDIKAVSNALANYENITKLAAYSESVDSLVRCSVEEGVKPNLKEIIKQYRTIYDMPYRDWETDRKSTRLNSSHSAKSRMPSSA